MHKILIVSAWFILCACGTIQNNTALNKRASDKEEKKSENSEIKKRYFEEVFSEITFETFSYGKNTTQAGKTIDLKLDIYQPKGDQLTKRPLIIFVHGGAFIKNARNTIKGLGFLQTLAKSGFVVASIDYRLIDVEQSPTSLPIGILNAIEDTRAAIRFFKKDVATKNQFKIDPEQIILGGYSAGAITTLFTAFLNSQEKVDTYFPPLSNYVKTHGGIEGNTGNNGYSSSIKGIFNVAGGMSNLNIIDNSIDFIYSLHGTKDTTVPFGDSPQLKGSQLIHKKATEIGLNSKLNAPEVDHGILYSCNKCRIDLQKYLAEQISQ